MNKGEIKEFRAKAKEAGITSWHLKSLDNLQKELDKLGEKLKKDPPKLAKPPQNNNPNEPNQEATGINIALSKDELKFLDSIGVKTEWLASLANQYGFTKFRYMAKFKAFRCYRENRHVDWIDVNDLALLNGSKQLIQIKQKHQQLPVKRRVIKLPWHDNYVIPINDRSMQ